MNRIILKIFEKKMALLVLSIWYISTMFGQEASIPLFFNNPKADYIAVDAQGNIFCVAHSQLYKYDINGKLLSTFSRFSLGAITSIDVANPMKIMLFYKESATILFLDDQLAPISEPLNLFAKNLYNITLASYSTTNHIWLYDPLGKELLEFDFYLNLIQKNRISASHLEPVRLVEIKEKTMAMHNPANGILLFDAFGSFIKNIAIITNNHIQILGNIIYYLEDHTYYQYDYLRLEQKKEAFQDTNAIQILKWHDRHIVLLANGTMVVY